MTRECFDLCVFPYFLFPSLSLTLSVAVSWLLCGSHRRIKQWESSQISNYGEADTLSALRKLEDAAFRWDHTNYIESMYVGGFEAYLTPYDFKQQIERSFRIHLTGAEVRVQYV